MKTMTRWVATGAIMTGLWGLNHSVTWAQAVNPLKPGNTTPVNAPPPAKAAPAIRQQAKEAKTPENRRILFEFDARYWNADIGGDAKIGSSGTGTEVTWENDLGLDDDNIPDLRLTWHVHRKHAVRIAYVSLGYQGQSTLSQAVTFDNITFPLSTDVSTTLDVDYYRLGWLIRPWTFDHTDFYFLGEIKGFSINANLSSNIAQAENETDGALLTVGVGVDHHINNWIDFYGEASGLPAGKFGYIYDIEGGIKVRPHRAFDVVLGYRVLAVKGADDDEDEYAIVRFAGPYTGLTVNF